MATEPIPPVQRYFTQRYLPDANGKPGQDQYVFQHSNRLCVSGLSPHHIALAEGKEITGVSFNVGKKGTDRLANKVSGKGKKGAQWLQPDSPLCIISCSDGTSYTAYSGVRGGLLEVNERLSEEPHLLRQQPEGEGFIAIVNPRLHEADTVLNGLLTSEEYEKVVRGRGEGGVGDTQVVMVGAEEGNAL